MYSDLEITRNRIAELHHLAERADLALAIRRARRARGDRSGQAMPPARPAVDMTVNLSWLANWPNDGQDR